MARSGRQAALFDSAVQLPQGLVYKPEFITRDEEEILLAMIESVSPSRTKYTIKEIGESVLTRRRAAWFSEARGDGLPRWLQPLRHRIAKWLDVPKERLTSALINEYLCGTGIGWHRDNEDVEHIVGLSLGGWCTMRFRPLPTDRSLDIDQINLDLEPRSCYVMQKDIRWNWQHSISPTKTHRYSITFRTLPIY